MNAGVTEPLRDDWHRERAKQKRAVRALPGGDA
jgi:hypothetical protein